MAINCNMPNMRLTYRLHLHTHKFYACVYYDNNDDDDNDKDDDQDEDDDKNER